MEMLLGPGDRISSVPGRLASIAARASGAKSRMIPRLVLAGAHRAVASTAANTVGPTGRCPASAITGPMAAALARKSS